MPVSSLFRPNLGNIAVWVVVLWTVLAIVGVLAQLGRAPQVSQSIFTQVMPFVICGSTILAYFVVLLARDSSTGRWVWGTFVTVVLVVIGWQIAAAPIVGSATPYELKHLLITAATWLIIAIPLVWFRLRPVPPSPCTAEQT